MREIWLRPNRRALLVALALPLLLLTAGAALALSQRGVSTLAVGLGLGLIGLGVCGVLGLVRLLCLPRLAYEEGKLLVYLRGAQPERVPIEFVEVFFPGQGPSMMPRRVGQAADSESETSTVVVRLAESAAQWAHRPVNKSLGHWCDGYITIRGTWCQPLTADLIMRLNQRLVDAHRRQRAARPAVSGGANQAGNHVSG